MSKNLKSNTPASTPKELVCLRCAWKWAPRKINGRPKRCPGCFSTSWMKPRKKSKRGMRFDRAMAELDALNEARQKCSGKK